MRKKKELQMLNRRNYDEGYQSLMTRVQINKLQEHKLDKQTIDTALEELHKERIRQKNIMVILTYYLHYYNNNIEKNCLISATIEQILNIRLILKVTLF